MKAAEFSASSRSKLHSAFLQVIASIQPYAVEPAQKQVFHEQGKRLLQQIARDLGYDNEQYDIRSNKGGTAVWGEVVFHADDLYIQLRIGAGLDLLYRSCSGRRDYVGKNNQWMRYTDFQQYFEVIAQLKKVRSRS